MLGEKKANTRMGRAEKCTSQNETDRIVGACVDLEALLKSISKIRMRIKKFFAGCRLHCPRQLDSQYQFRRGI